jgi:nicotinamidase-related amidase
MKQVLVVIDVQNEYFTGKMRITYPSGSMDNILAAMDAAARHGVPVIVVRHTALDPASSVFRDGSDGAKLHPAVARRTCNALIEKHLPGSFTGTNLLEWLKELGADTVVIAGYMTHMCCDTTARQAFHLGYAVRFLSDATATLALKNDAGAVTAEELHGAVLVVQQAKFSAVLSTAAWIESLNGNK